MADALSRKECLLTGLEINVVGLYEIKDLYPSDAFFGPFSLSVPQIEVLKIFYLHKGFFFKANKLCIPESSLHLLLLKESYGGGLM